MPTYDYCCDLDGVFEAQAGRDDTSVPCPTCRLSSRRQPFSGLPALKGETVARSIPDPAYRHEAEKRHLNQTWGDASRSVEMLRKNLYDDGSGIKKIDLKGMNE